MRFTKEEQAVTECRTWLPYKVGTRCLRRATWWIAESETSPFGRHACSQHLNVVAAIVLGERPAHEADRPLALTQLPGK